MSQSLQTYNDERGNESKKIGSQPQTSAETVPVPVEVIKAFANQSLQEKLDDYKKRLIDAQEKIRDLNDTCAGLSVDLYKIKNENELLYKQLMEQGNQLSSPDFCPLYDPRMFKDKKGNHPSPQWVRAFWEVLYRFAISTSEDGSYYIENSTSITIIFKLVHESTRISYQFIGTYDDFCTAWNFNIVSRIDGDRASKLTCKASVICAEYNKHWKEVSIGTLERKYDTFGQHKIIYDKANKIISNVIVELMALPLV